METPTRRQPNRTGQQLPTNRQNLPPVAFAFGKCLKNHAASTGGYALDGCGEFMATPNSTPTDLTALKCHACGCHRNFHHREVNQLQSRMERIIECPYQPQQYHLHPPTPPPPSRLVAIANNTRGTLDSLSPPPIPSSYCPAPPHMFFAFNPGFSAPQPVDKNRPSIITTGSNRRRKKRFRSKFSEEQKAKMQEFAERIGWKMLKSEEETIVGFCNQIGVDKGVFKVWMHNHKNIIVRDNHHQNRRDDGANGSSSSS
ncbi:zinc-finger homeodomain protein 10-like [Cynara cardunculus var. scolymus]|nr:zinc-finger homeodomain protein 10-like [Cynara cardunculus var. scolymus]